MFEWLWRLFRRSGGPGSCHAHMSEPPAWATAIPVYREPIQLCTALSPENLTASGPRRPQDAPCVRSATPTEELLEPVTGAENTVPWPVMAPFIARTLTFW